MLNTLLAAFLCVAPAHAEPRAAQDVGAGREGVAVAEALDLLIEQSAKVQTFSVLYRLTSTASEVPTTIRVDYQAPDKVLVERVAGPKSSSTWCVGGVMVLRSDESSQPMHGRIDSKSIYAELDALEQAVAAAYPAMKPRAERMETQVNMGWEFDTKEQKANFSLTSALVEDATTPFGWLTTLREKSVPAIEDGELLRFETDGAFKIAIARKTGLLHAFAGKSPKGEVKLELLSASIDAPIDPARFALPEAGAGRDVSGELRRAINRVAEMSLRRRMYVAIASEPVGEPPTPWNAEALAKIEPLLRAFHEHAVLGALRGFIDDAAKKRDGVTQYLKGLLEKGKTKDEVEAQRQKEIGFLTQRLDKLEQGVAKPIPLPVTKIELPRAAALSALEHDIVLDVFRTKVRAPTLAEFERVSKTALD